MSLLNRLGFDRHVTDADLAAVCADNRLGERPAASASAHVQGCPSCRARLSALTNWLDGLRSDARREVEEAFPRERLAAQQLQIMRRLEAMERPARVLAFPRFTRAISVPHVARQRWVAAAAVAGLIVGVGLGQTFDLRRAITPASVVSSTSSQIVQSQMVQGTNPAVAVRAPESPVSDEVFLYEQDLAPAAERVPESLRSLHEITPSVRDYDPR